METQLNLISERAGKEKQYRFNNLMHLINAANLRDSFYRLKADRASGIDGVSMGTYEKNLDDNIEALIARMKKWSYKPQAVRRTYIPKANGKLRPLGIPTVEDKMVQMCVTRILNAIFEQDFIETSYGFRPKRSCHDAIDKLDKVIMTNPVNHLIDADIKGFFDNVNHDWMMKCLEQRVTDTKLLRLIKRFLISGYLEDGVCHRTDVGTPQGGVISPVLANIYLHFVLDLWVEKIVKKRSKGFVELIRYADDFIICVQYKDDAAAIRECLKKRLAKFGLELAPDKTRIIEFGRFAKENAKKRGGKPGTFNFLGFTHFCDKGRSGTFKVGRKTDRKKFSVKVKDLNAWMKKVRNLMPFKQWWPVFCAKLRGHFQYFGVSGNSNGIYRFFSKAIGLLFKWINRRSQKKSYNWKDFQELLLRIKIPRPKIFHNLYTLYSS